MLWAIAHAKFCDDILSHKKNFLTSARSVCMAAEGYNGPLSTVSTNEQLLEEKWMCAKFFKIPV